MAIIINHTLLNAIRAENDGKLPEFAWPGGYQCYYFTEDGLSICADCANKPTDGAGATSDPVADADINYEDNALFCEDCGKKIPASYGED